MVKKVTVELAQAEANHESGRETHETTTRKTTSARSAFLRDCCYTIVWCAIYFGTGCAFYMNQYGWNGYQSLYFLMTTASTVGYGDFSPSSTGGRVFTVLYIF